MKKIAAVMVMSLGLMASPVAMMAQQGGSSIPADQKPTQEQLTKLFEVMRIKQQMQGMLGTITGAAKQQIQEQMNQMQPQGQPPMTAEQKEKAQKVLERYLDKTLSLYPADEMLADMSDLYKRHLSKSDVDAFIAFYSSPAGQHLLDAQPAIMQEYMPMVMSRMQSRMREMNLEMAKEIAEITKSAPPAQK